ncbi:hypothetical protein BXZ70DRAFT_1005757 [Cristinia sonorae]|uniref:Uncharacterized protein n=1 Tax=Cristinia sonorae TaxID=1940300 RepID=A0A8K0USS0_9AGAR|nr:hypothetical protein BXZ70DRAFT_1005757 [Cristinia sonorae]
MQLAGYVPVPFSKSGYRIGRRWQNIQSDQSGVTLTTMPMVYGYYYILTARRYFTVRKLFFDPMTA